MKVHHPRHSTIQIVLLLLVILTLLPTTITLQKFSDYRTVTHAQLTCTPQAHNQNSLQMVGCYIPTDTPLPTFKALQATPTPTPIPTPTPKKVPPTTGPPSKCSGTIVSFGVQKKLLNFGDGRPGTCFKPKWIVMHITAGSENTALQVFGYFNSGAGGRGVGTQFAIGKQGDDIQMTQSFTNKFETAYGVANYNNGSISIELTRLTIFSGKSQVPPKQYAEAVRLVKALMKQYNIPVGPNGYTWKGPNDSNVNPPSGVYGHYQFNPDTRTDPGAGFMRDFRKDIAK